MPEKENKNQNQVINYLVGDEGRDTQIAKKLLDEAGISYCFALADISEGTLPQLLSGLSNYVGLDQIGRMVERYKHRRSLANSV